MPEMTDTKVAGTDAGTRGGAPAQAPLPTTPPLNLEHTKVKGRFNQFTSGYWALTLPLLSVRYAFKFLSGVFERPLETLQKRMEHHLPRQIANFKHDLWPLGVGLGMVGVTSYYTISTYGDMKRQFAEPLGWEFDKSPENIGLGDMMKSKNALVRDAMQHFEKRTGLRFLVHTPFFLHLIPSPFAAGQDLVKADVAVDGGVGANALYLASDALTRKRTFFEEGQNVIDNKINHRDRIGETVTALDIMNLYDRQWRFNHQTLPLPKMDTPEWQDDLRLFARMADLMNQTYGNTPNQEQANFTMPKLIYLLGMGLVKSKDVEKNLAYVEVANRYGIPEAKKLAQAVNGGGHENLYAALASYPDILAKLKQEPSLTVTEADNAMLKSMGVAPEPVAAKPFTSETLKKERPQAPLASQADRITQNNEAAVGAALGG